MKTMPPMNLSYGRIISNCTVVFALQFFGFLVAGQDSPAVAGYLEWTDQPLLKNYSIEDGLPTHWVRGAVEDDFGFIWFATAGGLTRFDGHTFKLYPVQFDDDLKIEADRVQDLVIDQDGEIWISRLYRPLERFDPRTERSYSYASNQNALRNDNIFDLYFDPPHTIWVGHSSDGLISRIDKWSNEIISYQVDSVKVWDLFRDQDGHLWAATSQALYQFDSLSSVFKKYHFTFSGTKTGPTHFDNLQDFKSGKIIMETTWGPTVLDKKTKQMVALLELPKSNRSGINGYFIHDRHFLWMANPAHTNKKEGGIIRYDLITDEVAYFPLESDIPLFRDRSGNVWLHNGKSGVSSFKPGRRRFSNYQYPFQDDATAIIQLNKGQLWAADHKGLYQMVPDNQNSLKRTGPPISSTAGISSLLQAKDHSIWAAASDGLRRYFPDGSSQKYLEEFWANHSPEIHSIYEDSEGLIWLSGSILIQLSPESGVHRYYTDAGINNLTETQEDVFGNLWFANYNRVMVFDRERSQFFNFGPPYSNSVNSIYLDSESVWIGTNTGLYRMRLGPFDSLRGSSNDIECFNHLIPENLVVSIQGQSEIIWVVYPRGVASINTKNYQVETYGKKDGLSMVTLDQKLVKAFLGSDQGLYLAWPASLTRFSTEPTPQNLYRPPVVITDLKVFNQSVGLSDSLKGKPILSHAIFDTEAIDLPWGTSFSLEFASLDYTNPEMNRYQYKMEGIDDVWSPADFTRSVTYAKLSPGQYTFRVMASNNDGHWNEEGASLSIVISPPWWKAWWAYLLYGFGTVALVLAWIYHDKKQFMLSQKAKSLEEINQAKNEFFVNISHELRTPLTLIIGPLKALREGTYTGDTTSLLNMMSRNGDRILQLINQLLDLTKLDRGKMQLQSGLHNITELLRSIVTSFHSAASMKDIDLTFEQGSKDIFNLIDKEKISQVFYNLLSNALKFTPEGGQVKLSITGIRKLEDGEDCSRVKIIVRDSGIGIPKKELAKIFDRFYRVNRPDQHDAEGTGIGLELAQRLVHLHQGTVDVQSTPGQGSVFTITLPWIHQDDQLSETASGSDQYEILPENEQANHDPEANGLADSPYPVLLLVEDNAQMRSYIRFCLGDEFHYFEAENGNQGLELAENTLPDLILCDVMMPGMNGYDFCKKIRAQKATSHIPFIFLTARADQASKVKGLEMGSNDYLTKPFDDQELRLKVRNHLEKMQQYRTFFSEQLTLKGDIEPVQSLEKRFLGQALEVVEEYLDDHDFNVQEFAKHLGLSHTQLYRKLLTLTGLSPNAFILSIRLKKAAQLILQHYGNTSEVAYAVGFNNLSYFTKCFKQQFGVVPSGYAKKNSLHTSNKTH
jgi:signal transduction histidine kinase/DNA-binding response OmpR family regulator/ligand-binding sensor domain-containing protein